MASRFSIKAIFEAVDNLTRPLARIEGRVKSALRGTEAAAARATKALAGAARQTDRFVSGLSSAAKTVALAGGAAMAVGAASVVTAGANFEEAITAVGAVSLMTRDQIADLEKQALDLGSSTKFTATQVANGMELMGRAGFTNNEILAAMPGLLSAAAAEGGELSETVSTVSNTLKGMGLAASETQRVADVLTLASARTNSSITSLGESLKNAAPIARQFNIPLEQVTSAVALLQDVGIDASEAGTATATMLTLLAKPSKEAAAQMAALGLKFHDARGNMLPLNNIFAQFATASKKAGGNMKAAAFFADLVGMRGQRAALNLKDAFTSGKFGELTQELGKAAGSAEKMATLRMQNLKGDWEVFTGAVDGASTALFSLNSGAMRGVLQSAAKWVDANRDLVLTRVDEWVKKTADAVKDAIPKVEWFATGLVTGFREVSAAGRGLLAVVGKITGSTNSLFGSTGAEQAFNYGRAVVWTTAALVGISVASRVATVLTYGYRAAVIAVRGVVLLATGIKWAYVTATRASSAATVWNTTVTYASRAAQIARNVVAGVGAGLQWAYNAAIVAGTASLGPAAAATWALVAPLAAAALAIGSLVVLWKELDGLATQTGGWIGIWEGIKGVFTEGSFAKGADAHMNKKAKEEARARAARTPAQKEFDAAQQQLVAQQAAKQQAGREQAAVQQTDISTLPPGLFSGLGFGAEQSVGADPAETNKQLEQLNTTLGQLNLSLPPGLTAAPIVPGGGAMDPAAQASLAAPLDRYASRLEALEQRLAATKDRLVIDINDPSGSASVAQAPKHGRVAVKRPGVKVSDSGAP